MNQAPRVELTIAPGIDGSVQAHMLAIWHEPGQEVVESYIAVVECEREAHAFACRWAAYRGARSYWK
jgi:hypothetical protein